MAREELVMGAQATRTTGPQPGDVYRHYKGCEYVVTGRSVDEETLTPLVHYKSLKDGYEWSD